MGKQINFLMDRKTEEEFVNYLLKEGKILFEGINIQPESVTLLPIPFSVKGWFKAYFYKSEYGQLILSKLTNGRFIINSSKSPVIEFIRTIIIEDSKEISRGRLWVEMKYFDENDEVVQKNKGLDEWYKDLAKWIRKNTPKTELNIEGDRLIEYMSPTIKELIENEKYKIL